MNNLGWVLKDKNPTTFLPTPKSPPKRGLLKFPS